MNAYTITGMVSVLLVVEPSMKYPTGLNTMVQ